VLSSTEAEEHLVLSLPAVVIAAGHEASPGQLTAAELLVKEGRTTFTLLTPRPLAAGETVSCALDVPEAVELPALAAVVESVEEVTDYSSATFARNRLQVEKLPPLLHRLIYSRQVLAAEPPTQPTGAGK
jgi:hypothetical protein